MFVQENLSPFPHEGKQFFLDRGGIGLSLADPLSRLFTANVSGRFGLQQAEAIGRVPESLQRPEAGTLPLVWIG